MSIRLGARVPILVSLALWGCGEPGARPPGDGVGIPATTLSPGGDGPPDGPEPGAPEPQAPSSPHSPQGEDEGHGGDDEDSGGLELDLALPELPPDVPPPARPIPETCAQAQQAESTVGCRFYAVDLDSHDLFEHGQYAVAVANVQEDRVAEVRVEGKRGRGWTSVAPAVAIAPRDLHVFELPEHHQNNSGILVGGAYRVSSDVPIVAYQFNPIDGADSYLSDASMLYPVSAWDSIHHVVGWRVVLEGPLVHGAYATIVAAKDGTEVEIIPSRAILPGFGIPAVAAGVPFTIRLNEGDIAEVMTKELQQSLTGTRITSDPEHPIAVFAGNECSFVPTDVFACDHLEEQLAGLRRWGLHFIASRVPPRSNHDPALWQIYASEDATTIRLHSDPQVTGIPRDTWVLDSGDSIELYVGGTGKRPGDFEIVADKPIAVVHYMTGSENPGAGIGDPSMVQLASIEQFLARYVVLVPGTWIHDFAVVARPAGAPIELDGAPIDDSLFEPVAASGFEVARIPVADGVHTFDGGTAGFSVILVGYDAYDSYAYLGGTGTRVINPQ
jgi:hypothetical protein